jgi:hypothetical protein
VITVFPYYRVSLTMPGRYSPIFRCIQLRLELFPCGVAGKSNSPLFVRHDYKTHDLTNHANPPLYTWMGLMLLAVKSHIVTTTL